MRKRVIAASFPLLCAISCTSLTTVSKQELIVCGWDKVYILDFDQCDAQGHPKEVWSWKGADREDLPKKLRKAFGSTDECKPYDEGRKILITSSGYAVAYVDRVNDRVLFYASAVNPHSADLLPGNRIAVAASFDRNKNGDRLILYDISKSDKEILHVELPGAHGVVWDEKRQLLWAMSYYDIRVFKLENWDSDTPWLRKIKTIPLPEGAGHDCYPLADSPNMIVSTGGHVWLFNRDSLKFSLHPELGHLKNVKSISQHPITKQIVYVQADGKHWWTERVRFLNPKKSYKVSGEHFYKARWNIHIN